MEASLNQIIRDSLIFVETEAQRIKIDLSLDLDEDIPPIKIDAVQIGQVLLNLIRNAFEAIQDAHDTDNKLTVKTSLINDDFIEVAVIDTGKGLTTEELNKVFDPFFTTKSDGLGMGLSISSSIINSHGGKISATPNPDRGVPFNFTLPLKFEQ